MSYSNTTTVQIPVVVSGATGKMGREIIKAIAKAPDMNLVGAIGRQHLGEDIGEVVGIGELEIPVTNNLEVVLAQAAQESQLPVMIDVTHPSIIYDNIRSAIAYGVRPVVGTTGLTEKQIADLALFADKASTGCIIAPNFSVGVILMQQAAIAAARYYQHVEIIELHHNQKADAPSGTAIKTAQMLSELGQAFNPASVQEQEHLAGARGAVCGENIRIHSLRLPGLVARQEIIFGSMGETLKIEHNASDRTCYMAGVLLCVRKVLALKSLVYGLEKVLA
ncbi:4-hydroxy-tetrahydrodipicolinate reductase [Pseudanabaena sp. FACHB-1277]|uniref:4-hydroxy-tetrahydrodipicolinate reductase n=1 Tax=Pseudanabaena cinerea FACHB-1277 TaxID=2949581 RepID=A0A926Z850_9CYAN|nr:4-hydroxy-tetrahydrodipicolinate reductase [Pseudanabaena cinerea]MBD2152407.1 4-hydroxy-tetrahydrodipicolinate reductase [Pseudanabaena cinerea FACHB-1277]